MDIQGVSNVVSSSPVMVKAPVERTFVAQTPSTPLVKQVKQASAKEVDDSIANINQNLKKNDVNLDFSIDKASRIAVVKVTDSVTGDVIMQFPSKAVLSVSEAISSKQSGAFLKDSA
ncbi:MAG: flagellar protein FlaG [Methylotenera sp.]|nr:flagellar protein FlaG [Methylotenera sp.]